MKNNILLFDFDCIYKSQDFYKKDKYSYIYQNHLEGTDAYCDTIASTDIRKHIQNIALPAISFIGSGNYHYISMFLTEKIEEDFTLILFDNHTDMQKPIFDDLLSCGNWLRCAFESEKHLKQIILVGQSRISTKALDDRFKKKILAFPNDIITKRDDWYTDLANTIKYPVYISVDKDVFCNDVARTNWDQGNMDMYEFMKAVEYITENHKLIGMDVCGEFKNNINNISDFNKASKINNDANKNILDIRKKIIA